MARSGPPDWTYGRCGAPLRCSARRRAPRCAAIPRKRSVGGLMAQFLARIARALTQHWKRSLLAAIAVVALLGAFAATAGPAADDFETPGTESQEALDLFRAHS